MKDVKEFAPDVADEVFNKIPRLRTENAELLARAEKAEAIVKWCRPRLSKECYRATLDRMIVEESVPDHTPIVRGM